VKRTINQIRELELIEKELHNGTTGVLAMNVDEDKIAQAATTYLYLDKNVYIFFREDDELFEKIKFQTEVSFTIVRTEKVKKSTKAGFTPGYNIFSITISGLIKKLDDQKTIDDLTQNYLEKYSVGEKGGDKSPAKPGKVVLIDSREIQAIEEIGG
jgi:nitroimidazol reductase NimA-like FMN-containing flavoprotein (pyridoxamine 5'-phosphate oxidase superfamily)